MELVLCVDVCVVPVVLSAVVGHSGAAVLLGVMAGGVDFPVAPAGIAAQ